MKDECYVMLTFLTVIACQLGEIGHEKLLGYHKMAFFEMVIQSVPTYLNILVSENQWYVMGGGGIMV